MLVKFQFRACTSQVFELLRISNPFHFFFAAFLGKMPLAMAHSGNTRSLVGPSQSIRPTLLIPGPQNDGPGKAWGHTHHPRSLPKRCSVSYCASLRGSKNDSNSNSDRPPYIQGARASPFAPSLLVIANVGRLSDALLKPFLASIVHISGTVCEDVCQLLCC
jgi:hypothetical protein